MRTDLLMHLLQSQKMNSESQILVCCVAI